MKNWKEYVSLLLALALCLGMTICGKDDSNEEDVTNGDETGYGEDVSNGGEVSIEDSDGLWCPVDGVGLTTSVLISIYVDGTTGVWGEYGQYGSPTGNTGDAYTDGTVPTVVDVSFLGEAEGVETPIGDTDTLLDDDGETYWIKGQPDFKEKLGLLNIFDNWYYEDDRTSEYQTVLTLNEDGIYTRSDTEEGTYTFEEAKVPTTDVNTSETTTEPRQRVRLSGGSMDAPFHLANDGQALADWTKVNEGEEFYIHESVSENRELLRLCQTADGNGYWGEDYTSQFLRENILYRNYLNGTQDSVSGMWEISDDMITIAWDDGETDEVTLNPEKPDSLTLNSTGKTIARLFRKSTLCGRETKSNWEGKEGFGRRI